ncbi:MAG TPA: glycosyltransferase, partial [Thermogutta sp.]|nr:glycosyltransferase [Thermogutta sp.]
MRSVSLILVAYHGDRWIERCLRSLAEGNNGDWRVILVDNGGNSDLPGLVRRFAPGRVELLISPGWLPFAEANNFALLHGGLDSEFVCFLNQDTVSRPGWLDACLACLDESPTAGAVMPLIENYEGTGWDAAFLTCARAAPPLAARLEAGPGANLADLPRFLAVPEVTAAAMVVRTEALLRAGPFDP